MSKVGGLGVEGAPEDCFAADEAVGRLSCSESEAVPSELASITGEGDAVERERESGGVRGEEVLPRSLAGRDRGCEVFGIGEGSDKTGVWALSIGYAHSWGSWAGSMSNGGLMRASCERSISGAKGFDEAGHSLLSTRVYKPGQSYF